MSIRTYKYKNNKINFKERKSYDKTRSINNNCRKWINRN